MILVQHFTGHFTGNLGCKQDLANYMATPVKLISAFQQGSRMFKAASPLIATLEENKLVANGLWYQSRG